MSNTARSSRVLSRLGMVTSLFAGACSTARGQELPAPSAAPPPVIAFDAGAAKVDTASVLVATGETRAIARAELSSKSNGTLELVAVDEGARVNKGQVLFRIEGASAALQTRQAKAQLSAAQVALAGEELEIHRTRELAATGAVSPAALDNAKVAYDQATVAVEQAQVAVASAGKAVSDTVVRSPLNGVVAKKLKQAGESVAANGAPVLIVQDISRLEVRASLPETALASVRPGDRMQVTVRALARTYESRVERINTSIDMRSRTIEIVGILDNPSGELKAGLLTEVSFPDAPRSAP